MTFGVILLYHNLILRYAVVVQEDNHGRPWPCERGPQSGRDLVFRCYPPGLLSPAPQKTEADLLGQPHKIFSVIIY